MIMRRVFRDTVNGFIFWCIFKALVPMVWFFPLQLLGLSGYELFALVYATPLVCFIPGVTSLIRNRWMLAVMRLISVGSLASFQAPSASARVGYLGVGLGCCCLLMTSQVTSPSPKIRSQFYWSLVLGLFAFLASRVWYTTIHPAWWSETSNNVLIALGALAALDHIISGDDIATEVESPLPRSSRPYWLPASLGLGNLFYLLELCFGEVSLITRWVVKGYPDTGPAPYPWGAAVLLCLAFGVYTSQCHTVSNSFAWWLVSGFTGILVLFYVPRWWGFLGGLGLAVYAMSIWPRLFDQISACPPASVGIALIVYVVEVVFNVWTVAYNFVPGGVYTREHTDWLIMFVILTILGGVYSGGKITESKAAFVTVNKNKSPSGTHKLMLVLFVLAGFGGFGYRYNPERYQHPEKKSPREVTAAVWALRFGYDNSGWPSLERAAKTLNDTGADVITLVESDASKPFLGNNDIAMWLGEKLNMYVDFGPSTKDHTWGQLFLSKYPIVKSTHHLMPSPTGERAPAVTATVNFTGKLVDFVVGHIGNEEDQLDRELQAKYLAHELSITENPALFLSYITAAPLSENYYELINVGKVQDIDPTDMNRWCLYILYKGLIRLGYARITHAQLTDTEIQVGRFRIPEDPNSYSDHTKMTTNPEKVEERIRFNPIFGSFYGSHGYFTEHRFHMSTPKYFLP